MDKQVVISQGKYGVSVKMGESFSWCALGKRMDGTIGLTYDGTYHGIDAGSQKAEVEAAIIASINDGQERTVQIVEQPVVSTPVPKAWRSPRGLTLSQEMDRADSDY